MLGLDALAALRVIRVLRDLTSRGHMFSAPSINRRQIRSTCSASKTVCVCICMCVFVCVCVCVCVCQNIKRMPDKWQARQAKIASRKEKKIMEQEEAHFVNRISHPDKRKRERLSTKFTHVTVYLFGCSAKRRTCKRYSRKSLKLWNNHHRRQPLADLSTLGIIVHLALWTPSSWSRTIKLGTRTAKRKRKKMKAQK